MSQFIVSARKYRPQKFEEVIGQEQVTKTLKNELKSQQLAQSFLFCGPRGVGKTTCARILAKAINCENPSADMEPCNECSSCVSFNTSSSFNIHELDAASNNSVDGMRSLTDQVRFAPQAGKYKVYIIDEVHMLSQAAFNAFLKTLEEPPPYAIFILATTEKHKIIPTILSRCQIFDFKRIFVSDIVDHLKSISEKEGFETEDTGLHVIAQKADGALRDALSIFDKIVSSADGKITYDSVIENLNILDYDYFFKVTEQLLAEDSSSVLVSFDTVVSKGFEGDTFILGLAEHFRNLLMCKNEATIPLLEVSDDIAARYKEQAKICQQGFLLNALDLVSKCDVGYKMARNKRLHVELALLKICFINRVVSAPVITASPEKKNKPPEVVTKAAPEIPAKEKVEPVKTSQEKPELKQASATAAVPDVKIPKEDPVVKPAETEPDKIAPPSANSSGGLMAELEQALNSAQFNVEEQQKKESKPLTEASLLEAWQKFLVQNASELPSNFITNAKNINPVIDEEKTIVLTTYSSVSKGFVTEQGSRMKSYFREYFNQRDIQLRIDLEVDENEAEKEKKYMSPKEQFEALAKENPALIDFQKRFDLDIDYDSE